MWFGVVVNGGYDWREVEIGIGRGRGGWGVGGGGGGGLRALLLPLSGLAVLEIGGDGREEVFAGYGTVLVELGGQEVVVGGGESWDRDGVAEGHLGSGGRRWPSLVDPCSCLAGPAGVLEALRC